jgi:sugar O-acyltransferase (sialic acid O-acetyltransferase NeuD family)
MNGLPVLGVEESAALHPGAAAVIAIGSPGGRRAAAARAEGAGAEIATAVHPTARMSRNVEIGCGTLICAGSVLTTGISVGRCVVINLNCTIGHDAALGDYTTLSPGVHVSGYVRFGENVFVGTGAVFLSGTREKPLMIGDGAVIGAGACVTSDVPPGETWVGVPARHKNRP